MPREQFREQTKVEREYFDSLPKATPDTFRQIPEKALPISDVVTRKRMDFYVECQHCKNRVSIEKPKECSNEAHHLESNYCPKCEHEDCNEGNYWEEIVVNEAGEEICE